MRTLRVIDLAFDGVTRAPGGRREDTEGGFGHGGRRRSCVDDGPGKAAAHGMAATATCPSGRKTYQSMAASGGVILTARFAPAGGDAPTLDAPTYAAATPRGTG